MRRTLLIHPNSRCNAVARLTAEAVRRPSGVLTLRYEATGKINDIGLPEVKPSARADELWRHTCFEAFAQPTPGEAYVELNFSPSTQWAAYRFDKYREGMKAARGVATPVFSMRPENDRFELSAEIDLATELPADATWRLGLTAVIEETNGRLSYWALAHPPENPDFHQSDCFALELTPPLRL